MKAPRQSRYQRTLHPLPTEKISRARPGLRDKDGERSVSTHRGPKNADLCGCHHGTKETGSGFLTLALPLLCSFGKPNSPFQASVSQPENGDSRTCSGSEDRCDGQSETVRRKRRRECNDCSDIPSALHLVRKGPMTLLRDEEVEAQGGEVPDQGPWTVSSRASTPAASTDPKTKASSTTPQPPVGLSKANLHLKQFFKLVLKFKTRYNNCLNFQT